MRIENPWAKAVGGGAVLAAVVLLSGCDTLKSAFGSVAAPQPMFDQASLTDMTTVQTDGDALFAKLVVAGSCSYTANASGFTQVDGDLAALAKQVGTVANNTYTTKATAALQASFGAFENAAKGKGADCLLPVLVTDEKSGFDNAVAKLIAAENAKTKG